MKNEVEVKGIEPQSTRWEFRVQLHYQVLMCNDFIFDQKCKTVLKKETKNSGPSRETCDQALGWGIWTNLIISNLNWTVLLCASKKFMNKC